MSWLQGIIAAVGLAAAIGWGAAGAAVFRAWLNGVPPSGVAATFAALAACGVACQVLSLGLDAYQRVGRW